LEAPQYREARPSDAQPAADFEEDALRVRSRAANEVPDHGGVGLRDIGGVWAEDVSVHGVPPVSRTLNNNVNNADRLQNRHHV
jgi:hypothetical protein